MLCERTYIDTAANDAVKKESEGLIDENPLLPDCIFSTPELVLWETQMSGF